MQTYCKDDFVTRISIIVCFHVKLLCLQWLRSKVVGMRNFLSKGYADLLGFYSIILITRKQDSEDYDNGLFRVQFHIEVVVVCVLVRI